jgi:Fe-S oxidoreductase
MNPAKPEQPESGLKRQVVYMPSCVTRMMGPSLSDTERASVHEKMLSIFEKAGYEVIYPEVSCKDAHPRKAPVSSAWMREAMRCGCM